MAATVSDRTKAIIELAAQEAGRRGQGHLGRDHVLYAILDEGGGVACLALDRLRVDRRALLADARLRLQTGSQAADRAAATVSATLPPDLLSAAEAEASEPLSIGV